MSVTADQVTLKNGDRLTGKIIKADGKALVIKTEFAGEVVIDWNAVTVLDSDAQLYLVLADGRTVSGTVSTDTDQIIVRSSGGGSVSTTKSSVVRVRSETEQAEFLRQQNPGWLEQWSGSANVGLSLASGNSNTVNIATGLALTRQTQRDKTAVYASSIYSRERVDDVSNTTADIVRLGVRYDRDISPKWFGYVATDLEHNQSQSLTLRFVLGGGLGYHAIKKERTQLDLMCGADWSHETFSDNLDNRSSAELQCGEVFSHKLNSRMSLKEQFFIFPNLSDTGEFRANFDTTFAADITKKIAWQITVSDRYLSNPPFGADKNDLLLTTGISFKIGAASAK